MSGSQSSMRIINNYITVTHTHPQFTVYNVNHVGHISIMLKLSLVLLSFTPAGIKTAVFLPRKHNGVVLVWCRCWGYVFIFRRLDLTV